MIDILMNEMFVFETLANQSPGDKTSLTLEQAKKIWPFGTIDRIFEKFAATHWLNFGEGLQTITFERKHA